MMGCIFASARGRLVFILLLAVGASRVACAGGNSLTQIPMSQGRVFKVVYDPSTSARAYAVASSGIYKSSDAGSTWILINPGPGNALTDVAVNANLPGKAFAVGSGDGLYSTSNSGASFALTFVPQFESTAHEVAISADGSRVYFGTNEHFYRSIDGGTNWVAGEARNFAEMTALAVDPSNASHLYAALSNRTTPGLESTDGGNSWHAWTLPNQPGLVNALVTVGGHSPQIWAATYGGIYVSTDSGAHWTQSGTATEVGALAVDPTNPNVVYAGGRSRLIKSVNNGSAWSDIQGTAQIGDISSISVDPLQPSHLLVSGSEGVIRSNDGGSSWVLSNAGIDSLNVSQLFSVPLSDRLYVNGGAGVFTVDPTTYAVTSLNRDQLRPLNGTNALDTTGVFVGDSTNPDQLFVGLGNTVARSIDGGESWLRTPVSGFVTFPVQSILPASVDQRSLIGIARDAIYRSTDAGGSWSLAYQADGFTFSMMGANSKSNPAVIYLLVAAGTDQKILKSVDGGIHWTLLSSVLTACYAISVDPTDDRVVYVGGSNWISKSVDGGNSWSSPSSFGSNLLVYAIANDPANSNIVYAAALLGSVARSVDGGRHWQQLFDAGSNTTITVLAADVLRSGVLYIGTQGRGLYEFQVEPDLRLSIAPVAQVVAGGTATYAVSVRNSGSFDATRLRITAKLPSGASNVHTQFSSGDCAIQGESVECSVSALNASSTLDLRITAEQSVIGQGTISASVAADEADSDPSNNSASVPVIVAEESDLALALSGPASVNTQSAVEYVLTISNAGPEDAHNAALDFDVDASLTNLMASSSTANCIAVSNHVHCDVPLVKAGSAATVTVGAVSGAANGSFTSSGVVKAGGYDPDAGNNTASATVQVVSVSVPGTASSPPASEPTTPSGSDPSPATSASSTPASSSPSPTPSTSSSAANSGGKGGGGGGGVSLDMLACLVALQLMRRLSSKSRPRQAKLRF